MTNRYVGGNLGGGVFGARASLPGYDVLTEPFGSSGISFDTRLTDIGTVIAAGLIQCGGGAISFPTVPYVPIAHIARWDGADLFDYDLYQKTASGLAYGHSWIPALAIVTTSSIQVTAFSTPWFDPTATFNPNGYWYLYYVFASG